VSSSPLSSLLPWPLLPPTDEATALASMALRAETRGVVAAMRSNGTGEHRKRVSGATDMVECEVVAVLAWRIRNASITASSSSTACNERLTHSAPSRPWPQKAVIAPQSVLWAAVGSSRVVPPGPVSVMVNGAGAASALSTDELECVPAPAAQQHTTTQAARERDRTALMSRQARAEPNQELMNASSSRAAPLAKPGAAW
jgi:hypothetical protein